MASESEPSESQAASGSGAAGAGASARKVTAAEIARDWECSRAYVSKCITHKGCPTESLEAARDWRSANAKYGVGYRSKGHPAPASEPAAPVRPQVTSISVNEGELQSLEASLRAAVRVEEQALQLVESAMNDGKPSILESRLRSYNVACKNRSEREEAVREEMERRGLLISMDASKALWARGWRVVVPKLLAMGSQIGVRCNQENPLLAAETIDQEVRSILREGEKAYAGESEVANAA